MSPHPPQGRPPRGWRRRLLGLLLGLAVLAASGLAGLWAAQQAGPERLRLEIERQLAEITGAPSSLPSLEVRLGLPVEFVGRGLSLWNGALEVEQLTARVSVAAALMGELEVTRLEADGLVLRLSGGADRAPSPPWLAPAEGEPEPERADASGPERAAAAFTAVLRAVLSKPFLADRIEVRGGRVELDWATGSAPLELALDGVDGELWHSQLLDRSALELRGALERGGRVRGRIELEARRSADDAHTLGLAFSDLDLAVANELLPDFEPRLRGHLSGVADFALPADAAAAAGLDFELLLRELAVSGEKPWWSSPRASLRGRLEAGPGQLRLRGGRVQSDPLDLNLQLDLGRPLAPGSELDLVAGLAGMTVEQVPALLDVLPVLDGDSTRAVLHSLEAGRIGSVSLSGAGSVDSWRSALAGKAGSLREPFRVQAAVEDLRVRLDRDDRIDRAGFRFELVGDTLTLSKARGLREGHPLPLLDLELQGLSHLLGANLERRVPEHDGAVLAGLPLLIKLFQPDPDAAGASEFRSPHVAVSIQRVAHPTLLWPLHDVELSVDAYEGGLKAEVARARWAGVPLSGHLDWNLDRDHLSAKVALQGPAPGRPGTAVDASGPGESSTEWARGSIRIERLESRFWSHEQMSGDFRVSGAKLRFAGLRSELLPQGNARGGGEIDLGHPDHLPYRFAVEGRGLDAGALFAQVGLGEDLVTGTLDLKGEIHDRYEPGAPPLAHLGGELELSARDGEVRHNMPVVLALTLASDIFRLKPGSNTVRFDTCQATLEAEEGVVRTSGLQLDGPDVRLFGSGTLNLGRPPQNIDAELAVFLLRPVDQALGSIPIVGSLLLGNSDNLVAAYFRLRGPWKAPVATAQPLRSFYTGPLRLMEKVPGVVLRGVEALGGAVRLAPSEEAPRRRLPWRRRRGASDTGAETSPGSPAGPGTAPEASATPGTPP